MLDLKNKLILAPMADVTDIAFRILCRRYGAGLAVTEMIHTTALVKGNQKTSRMVQTDPEDRPLSIQLFGDEVEMIPKAVKIIEDSADMIDYNMGCPADKIVGNGCGAAILDYPEKIEKIVTSLRKSTNKPITVKIRTGNTDDTATRNARIIESAGADAITIHARTAQQGYSGRADWNVIKAVKDAVSIPVIGNGDVKSIDDATRMRKETGCDAVMIGRAAIGNPAVFCDKKVDKLKLYQEYLELAKRFDIPFNQIKKHAQWFTKGIEGAAVIREKLNFASSVAQIQEIIR